MYFKLLLIFASILAINAQYFTPPPDNSVHVTIGVYHDMTPSMQLDASDFLKAAFTPGRPQPTLAAACTHLRDAFNNKYHDYLWHVVVYRALAIQSLKSIELSIGNDRYYLFATKK